MSARHANRFRPALECFEDRVVPTLATVSVAALGDTVEGGTGATFRLTRDTVARLLTVYVTYSGTATSGADYSALASTVTFPNGSNTVDVTVTPLVDNIVEGSETVKLNIAIGPDYIVGSPADATLTIEDDPPVVAVTATDTSEGAATGGFSFTRSGGDLSSALAVGYTVGGTATAGTDYTTLSGTVTFAAGVDRVEVPVEAFCDNINDDGETVTTAIDSGGTGYTIDPDADEATVTIADQPLTVSVIRLTDGEEGVSDPTFEFLRSGDIVGSLTVLYTVGGTAIAGTDYTALSGSVTFAANSDHTNVTVHLIDNSTADPTRTVSLTVTPSTDFTTGSDTDTAFIEDNDTNRVIWLGGHGSGPSDWTNWNVAANWTSNAVPTASDDVYFDGSVSNSYNCANVGYGISAPLRGLHIVNGFSQTLTLNNALTVKTYEQTTGLLNQPSARALTITGTMLWTGGTLDATGSGANVNVDGATAIIDPPDSGSMSTSSTFRLINSALGTFLPGTLAFAAGNGLFIAGNAKGEVFTKENIAVKWTKSSEVATAVEVAWDSTLEFVSIDSTRSGKCVSDLPISNAGTLSLLRTVHLEVNGHAGGGNGPSLLQTNGTMNWWTGSNVVTQFGMKLYSGTLQFNVQQENRKAVAVGDLTVGSDATTPSIAFVGAEFGEFEVQGNARWASGVFKPRVDINNLLDNDRWSATREMSVGTQVSVSPVVSGSTILPRSWLILSGGKILTSDNGSVPGVTGFPTWSISPDQDTGVNKYWFLQKPRD